MEQVLNAFTHAGIFHADDIFSSALLKLVFPRINIQRGYSVPENFDGIVFDIGYGEFDHHQNNKEIREDGTPYASFGLLWRKYGKEILNGNHQKEFDNYFIKQLDRHDNEGTGDSLCKVIKSFNSPWDSDDRISNELYGFENAVLFAESILKREFEHMLLLDEAEFLVNQALKTKSCNIIKGVLILPKYCPWIDFVIDSDIVFGIYPSKRNGYNIQGVPLEKGNPKLKKYLPEEWLKNKPSGLEFIHNGLFLASASTLQDAIWLAKLAMET